MGSKRRRSMDAADHQAKRMKHVLNISSDSGNYQEDGDKEPTEFGPWESYVSTHLATRNISVVLRCPNDERYSLNLNDACQLKVLFAFLQNHGLDPTVHSLTLLYPKRDYTLQMVASTLGELNFHSQELIHVNRQIV